MKFYKVKKEADNKRKAKINIYVENELFTENEVEKYSLNKNYLEVVEVPKNKTYWFFGARFANAN